MDEIRSAFARHDLYRSRDSRWLGGVCAGLGRRYGFSPGAARLLFVLGLLIIPGSQVLLYPALWVLMPREGWQPATGTTGPTSYA
ncbi:MAG: hypothetical protein JWL64_988 [Frankiales bacterium]|nr:hypothetical protein [Frankiales bacterium]